MRLTKLVSIFLFVVAMLSSAWAAQQPVSKTFSGAGRLEVNVSQGDVVLNIWGRNEVAVTAIGIDPNSFSAEQVGDVVRVATKGDRSRWGGGFRDSRFEVSLPETLSLEIRTGGGDIRINGDVSGSVSLRTSGGDIGFKDIRNELSAETMGGDISGGSVSGNSTAETMGGDIHFENVEGSLEVRTKGGDIGIENVGGKLVAESMGGDIRVADVGASAEVNTYGGDIKLGQVRADVSVDTKGGDIEVESAEGKVKARTAGGDVALMNVRGIVEADTAGGDITVELDPTGDTTLTSKAGSLTLILAEGAAVTVEAIVNLDKGWWGRDSRDRKPSIASDFAEATRDESDSSVRSTYRVNGGGFKIRLETWHGDIKIKKGRSRQ